MDKKGFLEHLAGLRGLAIIMVILFHLDSSMCAHGYLGVDVFLVISGYLIFRSRIARPGVYTLRDTGIYIARRIQRIMPPVCIIIIPTLLLGVLLLWQQDAALLAKVSYGACLVKANAVLANLFSDYFATDAAFVPLLHLWYVSAILQVYLFFAVANLALQRLPGRWAVGALVAAGIASLIYCYSAPIYDALKALGLPLSGVLQAPSYYNTLPRLWEVLAGGLVCVLPGCTKRMWADAATALGLLCLLLLTLSRCLPGVEFSTPVPEVILVVCSTVLVLRYAPESCLRCFLSNPLLTGLGAISFSLYLVHMPIIVYLRMWWLGQPSAWGYAAMLSLTLLVGVVFWYCIEKRRYPWWLVLLLWVGCTVLCHKGRKSGGFASWHAPSNWSIPAYDDWRINDKPELLQGFRKHDFRIIAGAFGMMNTHRPHPSDAPFIALGDDTQPLSCLLVGDSHAMHSCVGLDQALRDEAISGVYLSAYICPFHGWVEDKKAVLSSGTPPWESALRDWLRLHPEITHVIIAQRWHLRLQSADSSHVQDLRLFLTALRELNKQVILIGPTPEFPPQAAFLHFDKILKLRGISGAAADAAAAVCTREAYLERNKVALAVLDAMQQEGLGTVVHPLDTLPPGDVFRSVRGGVLQMFDGHHMSPPLSTQLMQALRPALRALLRP